jgi:long-subunit fatty acid transport protein
VKLISPAIKNRPIVPMTVKRQSDRSKFGYNIIQRTMVCLGFGTLLTSLGLEGNAIQYFFGINYENPAELQRVQTGEINCGFDYLYTGMKFKGTTFLEGSGTAKSNRSLYAPSFQIAYRAQEKIVLALSYTTPELGYIEWGTNSILRNSSTKTLVYGSKVSPRISCQYTDNLALGCGLDIYFTPISNQLNFVDNGFGNLKNKFKFLFLGFDVGLYYRFTCNTFISLCYYSGKPARAHGSCHAESGESTDDLTFNPTSPWFAYGNLIHHFNECFSANFIVLYSGFSIAKELLLFNTVAGDFILRTRWKDTWTFNLGANWKIDEYWELSGFLEYNTNFAIRKFNAVAYPGSEVGVIKLGVSRKFCDNFRWYLEYGYAAFIPMAKINNVDTLDKGRVSLCGNHVGARIVYSW